MHSLKSLTLYVSVAAAFAQAPATTPKPKPAPAAKSGPVRTAPAKPASKPVGAATPAATPAAPAGDPSDPVVLTIGAEKVTQKQFESFLQQLPEQYRAQAQGPMKRQLAQQYAQVRALAQEARRRGIDQQEGIKMQMSFQQDNILAGALFRELQEKTATDDSALRSYYDAHAKEYEEVQASHILIKAKGSPVPNREGQKELTEPEALAKAQDLRKKLESGADFATLAKAESDDTGSGAQGGSLGTFRRGSMVPAFEEVAFTLPANQISEPIKTQFGYHLIKVDKHFAKSFEEMKPELEKRLKPEAARKVVDEVTQQAHIVINDSFFGPEQKQPVPSPAAAP